MSDGTKTQEQQANEAKTSELEAVAAETLARIEANDGQPTEAKIEILGIGIEVPTVIMCEDGQPILTPSEVRSMRDGMGISRPMLIELTGINGYRCWAAEQQSKADEADAIEWRKIVSVVLRKVDQNGLPEEMRPKARKGGRKPASDEIEALKAEINKLRLQLAAANIALGKIDDVKSLKEAKAMAAEAFIVDFTDEGTIEA